jgi:hypothetical protein
MFIHNNECFIGFSVDSRFTCFQKCSKLKQRCGVWFSFYFLLQIFKSCELCFRFEVTSCCQSWKIWIFFQWIFTQIILYFSFHSHCLLFWCNNHCHMKMEKVILAKRIKTIHYFCHSCVKKWKSSSS